VGRDEQMRPLVGLINLEVSWNQPEELTEQIDLDQQVQLTEVKDQDGILMIGGIGIFLPFAQEEAEVDKEEDENSVECLNEFSQRAESAVALELIAK
jgi:hypothetical protein